MRELQIVALVGLIATMVAMIGSEKLAEMELRAYLARQQFEYEMTKGR